MPAESVNFEVDPAVIKYQGYQGAARHTYTPACDGFHESEQCPRSDPSPSA